MAKKAKRSKKQPVSESVASTIALGRIGLGLVLFWAFLDKLWGLGFSTCRDAATGAVEVMCSSAWAAGGSPTTGFLQFGSSGPLQEFYSSLAGVAVIDWLFMLGLGLIGLSLLLGIGIRVAVTAGILLFLMMWSATLPPDTHPFISSHLIYIVVLVLVFQSNNHQRFGFGSQWTETKTVKKHRWLE